MKRSDNKVLSEETTRRSRRRKPKAKVQSVIAFGSNATIHQSTTSSSTSRSKLRPRKTRADKNNGDKEKINKKKSTT